MKKQILVPLLILLVVSVSAAQQLTSSVYQYWSGTSWENSIRTTYTYDGMGNLTQLVSEMYQNDQWVNFQKETYTGSITLNYAWVNDAWVLDRRTTYTFDGSGNLISEFTENYNSSNDTYTNLSKTDYTNNVSGDPTQTITYSWSSSTSTWNDLSKSTYTYSSGNLSMVVEENYSGSSWTPSVKRTYTYNTNNQETGSLSQSYNGSSWNNINQSTTSYEANGTMTEYLTESWDNGSWKTSTKTTYSYGSVAGSQGRLEEDLVVFPNPTEGVLSVKSSSLAVEYILTVTDAYGKVILQNVDACSLNLESVPSGIYFLHVKKEDRSAVIKIERK